MVLATQNPVDLDYKAMSNAGTWLVGRLQTERDKERVLEGLRSAAGDTDVAELDEAIGGLQQRQFLLVSAHEPKLVVFTTRWAMSYLRGPLTKEQIGTLTQGAAPPPPVQPTAAVAAPAAPAAPPGAAAVAPAVAPGVLVRHVHPAATWLAQVGGDPHGTQLRAFLAARASVRFDDSAAELDTTEEWEALYGPLDNGLRLDSETPVDYDERDFQPEPPAAGSYVVPQVPLGDASFFRDAQNQIEQQLVAGQTLTIFRNRPLKLFSRPNETQEQFAARADEAAQAAADAEAAKIRDRLETKRDRLEAALETARRRTEELEVEQKSRTTTELLAGAGNVLSVLLGGRGRARTIARAGSAIGTAASRRGMTARAAERRRTAEQKVEEKTDELEELEQEILDEVTEIDARWDEQAKEIETAEVRPEAADVRVVELALVWVPTA
jgi:hypothetical protein